MRYFYANGGIHPFEQSEEGLTLPQWAMQFSGDEGSDFRMLSDEENDEYVRQQGIKDLGFDMGAAQWAGNEQAYVENPATGQMEMIVNTPQGPMLTSQAEAAGVTATPLMKPQETGNILTQLMELSEGPRWLASMAGIAGLAGNGLNALLSGGMGGLADFGSQTISNTIDKYTNLPDTISNGFNNVVSSVTDGAPNTSTLSYTLDNPDTYTTNDYTTRMSLDDQFSGSQWQGDVPEMPNYVEPTSYPLQNGSSSLAGLATTGGAAAGLGGATAGGETGLSLGSAAPTPNIPNMGGGQGLVAGAGTLFGGAALANAVGAGGTAGSVANTFGTGGLNPANTGVSIPGTSGTTGSYQIPWGQIIGGLGEYVGQQQYGKDIADAMKYAVDKADPFASQRPFYQGELNKMFTDPNYFQNNALLKGANDMAVNDTTRKLASQGYNMSGNVPMEVGQRLQQNNMSFAQNLMNQTGGFAGAGFGPGQAGTIAGNLGTQQAQTGLNSNGALGTIFNAAYNGQQPTLANQVLNGQQPNQNLYQYLFT